MPAVEVDGLPSRAGGGRGYPANGAAEAARRRRESADLQVTARSHDAALPASGGGLGGRMGQARCCCHGHGPEVGGTADDAAALQPRGRQPRRDRLQGRYSQASGLVSEPPGCRGRRRGRPRAATRPAAGRRGRGARSALEADDLDLARLDETTEDHVVIRVVVLKPVSPSPLSSARLLREKLSHAGVLFAVPDRKSDGYRPTGDQPQAIDQLSPRSRRRAIRDAARRDRDRQDGDDGLDHREGRPAVARDRAQQDAGRAALQRVRQFFRTTRSSTSSRTTTTTTRGLRPPGRPLHREGLVPERRHSRLRLAATSALFTRRDVASSPRSRAPTASARRRSGAAARPCSRLGRRPTATMRCGRWSSARRARRLRRSRAAASA